MPVARAATLVHVDQENIIEKNAKKEQKIKREEGSGNGKDEAARLN
jgi:hypothetical protein